MNDEPLYCPGCGLEECDRACDWWARFFATQGDPNAVLPPFLYCELCGAKEPCPVCPTPARVSA
jgi:hypothetical protein